MQMLFAAMLIDAPHSTLEDRIVALDRIRVDHALALAANVLIDVVLDRTVVGELFADAPVPKRLIRHQVAFATDNEQRYLG
jgi:hypothetical protein